MYQTLEDLEKNQYLENEQNKPRKWIKWALLVLLLIVWFFIVLIIYNLNIKESNSSLSYSDSSEDSNPSDKNIKLDEDSLFSRILQLEPEENNPDYFDSNEKILEQLNDESFWDKKIEETIDKEIAQYSKRWEVEILWYWLLCDEYEENLWNCKFYIWFSNKVDNYNSRGNTSYEVYWVSTSSHSINWFSYHVVAKQIAMNDIWNWGVFYDVSDRKYSEEEFIKKYLWEDFESNYTGDYRFIEVVHLLTNNDDWTSNYHLYIISNESWEALYKDSIKIISRESAENIIAENAWINVDKIKYLRLKINKLVYEANFSYNWHTYDYKIDAKDGTIIKGWDEIDVWDEKALEIAIKDSWIKSDDLRRDVSHWHWIEKTLLMPEVNKEWTGSDAVYNVEIETEDGLIYTYQIRATDGKILSKYYSEKFIIYDEEWAKKNITYRIKSIHKKSKELEINPSELDMDDIYEYKDQIYLWITFDWDKIADWSIIDRPYKHMWKMTRDELDEYYNFESHYSTKTIDKIFSESTEIKLSEFDENVLYKIKIWQICRLNIINDTENDVIVYQGYYWEGAYETTPYLKDGYAWSRGCVTVRWNSDDYYSILYKKASSKDLFKVIDKKELTYLSKFKVWDEINLNQRHNENYLYNDTDNDLTISVTDYWIVNAPEDFQFVIKPWKFAHCYEYTDIVKIIK